MSDQVNHIHDSDCWRNYHACAVAEIERLRATTISLSHYQHVENRMVVMSKELEGFYTDLDTARRELADAMRGLAFANEERGGWEIEIANLKRELAAAVRTVGLQETAIRNTEGELTETQRLALNAGARAASLENDLTAANERLTAVAGYAATFLAHSNPRYLKVAYELGEILGLSPDGLTAIATGTAARQEGKQ